MAIDVYISEEKIKQRVKELGKQITADYQGEELVVVGVLNGAFVFCADLIREIKLPLYMEFLGASSYGDSTSSNGNVKITLDLKKDIQGKNILLVEDIIDTGLTISNLFDIFKNDSFSTYHLPDLPKEIKVGRIDYIFASSSFAVRDKTYILREQIMDESGKLFFASDHMGLVATFSLT